MIVKSKWAKYTAFLQMKRIISVHLTKIVTYKELLF